MNRKTKKYNWLRLRLIFVLPILIIALIVTATAAASEKRETILRLHGSNTIGATLAPDLAEEFLKLLGADSVTRKSITPNTEIDVEGNFSEEGMVRVIEIRAHGSSTGFQDLNNNRCDIAMSSREVNAEEVRKLSSLGEMTAVTCEHTLALDGVAIIINASNKSVSTMDLKTLGNIFSGKIDNWSGIGGNDAPIHLHIRDELSGTYDSFNSIVMENGSVASTAKRWDSNEELSEAVNRDKYAIGICGLPYVGNNKTLEISDGGVPIAPSPLTIATEDYPITRRLYLYTPAEPKNTYTINFIAFALGKGQRNIAKEHFVPLTITAVEHPVEMIGAVQESKVFNKYIQAVSGAKRLSTNYRFKTATDQLDSRAWRDLDRMADFLKENPAEKIILAGFTDSKGDYWNNYKLSCSRAQAVKEKLYARGITVQQMLCLSEEVPLASNATKAGQAKNRRVEIWIK